MQKVWRLSLLKILSLLLMDSISQILSPKKGKIENLVKTCSKMGLVWYKSMLFQFWGFELLFWTAEQS